MAIDTSKERLEKLKREASIAPPPPRGFSRRMPILAVVLAALAFVYIRSRPTERLPSSPAESGGAPARATTGPGEPTRDLIAEWERDHHAPQDQATGATQEPTTSQTGAAVEGDIGVRNSAGRSGSFYLPAGYAQKVLPLAVLLHGTGGSGRNMLVEFRPLAEEYGFAIVAPDSRRSPDGQLTWQVGDHPGDVTEDVGHTMDCVRALRSINGVQLNLEKTLIAGHSGGGSSAPYISSHESLFQAFAVLHGGIIPNGFGSNRVRGWFSTGAADSLRSPAGVRAAVEELRREGWSAELELRTYPGGHELTEPEKRELIRWWLRG